MDSIDFDVFREKITSLCASALESAYDSIRDPRVAEAVAGVKHEIIWKPEHPVSVCSDDNYLTMLLDELLSNALLHGNFVKNQTIQTTVCSEADGYVWIDVTNPISLDEKQKLIDTLSRRRLLLGLTQIDLLARAYSLPPPKFHVSPHKERFEVTCALARVAVTHIGTPALESR
jgi:hypothetical protein